MVHKATKIVATISDLRCDVDFLKQVIAEGVNVVRMNTAHMTEEGYDRVIRNVRAVSNKVGILMDTKGPEVRTTGTDEPLVYKTGEEVAIAANPLQTSTHEVLSVNYAGFVNDVAEGHHILIDDGLIDLLVVKKERDLLRCTALNDGVVGSRKSVNVPGAHFKLPALNEKDHRAILYAIDHGVDFIAHSFVRSKEDVLEIQRILDEHKSPIKIISKIENQQGIDHIDEIIDASYGIMVARGDLGIELEFEKIPALQSMMVRKCIAKKKPVIVATQMLHTMMTSPRPTRAEVSDVSGAIMMNTDAVMLSGETASGKYPVDAVRTMAAIIREAEQHKTWTDKKIKPSASKNEIDITGFIAKQTVRSVDQLGVKAIINDTFSGLTARSLASYRGNAPIYAICFDERKCRELSLSYGVHAFYRKNTGGDKGIFYYDTLRELLGRGMLRENDLVAYVGGMLSDETGTTTLTINRVKEAIEYYAAQHPEEVPEHIEGD